MSSFINKINIPSEIMTKSSTSLSHTAPNRVYRSKTINEILAKTDDEIEKLMESTDFKSLHDDLKKFYGSNKHLKENQLNHLFEEFLQNRSISCVHDTCNYGDKIFTDLFANLKPDMSWNSTIGTRLNEFSCCPFYYKSIIELKKSTFKNKDYDQLSSYLTSILRYSPGRTFIIGCITNFQNSCLIKVSYDEQTNEIKYIIQAMITLLTGLEILTLYLGLSDDELDYQEKFAKFLFEKKIKFLNYLGRGSSSFVFHCEYEQESLKNIVVKISRQDSSKEKFIIEKMNGIKPHDINLIKCVNMDLNEENSNFLIGFNVRGNKLEGAFAQSFINNTKLLINTWKQINLCHQIGFIHSDIRIGNLIVYNNEIYVIDYNSSMQVGIADFYRGCLSTASNAVLKILEMNNIQGQTMDKIYLYYADDSISFLKMILLLKPYFEKYTLMIRQAIVDGMPSHILSTYEYSMKILHNEKLIQTITYLEKHREILDIDSINSIMIYTLQEENGSNYDINEHLKKLCLES